MMTQGPGARLTFVAPVPTVGSYVEMVSGINSITRSRGALERRLPNGWKVDWDDYPLTGGDLVDGRDEFLVIRP